MGLRLLRSEVFCRFVLILNLYIKYDFDIEICCFFVENLGFILKIKDLSVFRRPV